MTLAQQIAAIESTYRNEVARLTPAPVQRLALVPPLPLDDFAVYRGIKAVNWSKLKNMRDSPLHYLHGLTAPDVDSPIRLLGRVGHTLALEPQKFEREYAVYDGDGSIASVDYKAFARANVGKQIVKGKGIVAARGMAASVRAHPVASKLLEGALTEQTLTWVDPDTGLACKARVDFLNPTTRLLGDYKTTNSINSRRFGALAARLGHHCQLAHYANGCRIALGWEPELVKIIASESAEPHDCAVYALEPDDIEAGREEVSRLMAQLAECYATNVWPGQCPDESRLVLPPWIFVNGSPEITFDNEEESE